MRSARRATAAALNILGGYHSQEVMLEQTYPSGGSGSGSLRESFETAESGRSLLAMADSLFGLLLSAEGRYTGTGRGLRFSDPVVAREYRALRDRIVALMTAIPAIARDGSGIGATGRLRRVVGDSLPPLAAD